MAKTGLPVLQAYLPIVLALLTTTVTPSISPPITTPPPSLVHRDLNNSFIGYWSPPGADQACMYTQNNIKQTEDMSVGNHVFTGGSAVQPQLSVMPMRALQAEYR